MKLFYLTVTSGSFRICEQCGIEYCILRSHLKTAYQTIQLQILGNRNRTGVFFRCFLIGYGIRFFGKISGNNKTIFLSCFLRNLICQYQTGILEFLCIGQ